MHAETTGRSNDQFSLSPSYLLFHSTQEGIWGQPRVMHCFYHDFSFLPASTRTTRMIFSGTKAPNIYCFSTKCNAFFFWSLQLNELVSFFFLIFYLAEYVTYLYKKGNLWWVIGSLAQSKGLRQSSLERPVKPCGQRPGKDSSMLTEHLIMIPQHKQSSET